MQWKKAVDPFPGFFHLLLFCGVLPLPKRLKATRYPLTGYGFAWLQVSVAWLEAAAGDEMKLRPSTRLEEPPIYL